jgi:hypothetical protein
MAMTRGESNRSEGCPEGKCPQCAEVASEERCAGDLRDNFNQTFHRALTCQGIVLIAEDQGRRVGGVTEAPQELGEMIRQPAGGQCDDDCGCLGIATLAAR